MQTHVVDHEIVRCARDTGNEDPVQCLIENIPRMLIREDGVLGPCQDLGSVLRLMVQESCQSLTSRPQEAAHL